MITRSRVVQTPSLVTDLLLVTALCALIYGLIRIAAHWEAPLQPVVEIDLSLKALPVYTLLSLLRGFIAYGLSLAFALTYGYLAAHRPRAERILLPLLDILQSIPVLGFLPGAVLALVALFPRTNVGLEVASILMIFTGQVWNMAFSFYQSVRNIPSELREVSSLYRFNWWQRFFRIELPASTVSLAWNSMMAMAGGWFFLMVCEAFTLNGHDFRLPGLGSYMSVAISHHNVPAIFAGIAAMILMIVLVDRLIWKPLIVYAQRFRMEETSKGEPETSIVLNWLQRSWFVQVAAPRVGGRISEWLFSSSPAKSDSYESAPPPKNPISVNLLRLLNWIFVGAAGGLFLWGTWNLVRLLAGVPGREWIRVLTGAGLTFLRVTTAVGAGSLWAVPVGIWIGQSKKRTHLFQPFVQVAASFPAPMIYPLILGVFHRLGWQLNLTAIVLMLLGTQWYILFNVIAGASSVPDDFLEVAEAYHFTPWQRWSKVWLPAIFPFLITGWVTAAGGAWNASIVAECVSTGKQVFVTEGLGSLISVAAGEGRYDLLAAAVLTMAMGVVFINRFVWRALYRLSETRYASS